ncbi:hypothetical protein BKA69DRAFT_464333 [Paraphysoderma sedebokerense]|nr:hypothetical protein BKA69DRAFT_464333 [Paraphysoderma sedebokerense]
MICIWEGANTVRLYSTPSFLLQQTITLANPFTGLYFDLVGARNASGTGLYFAYRDQNGKLFVQGRNNSFGLISEGNFPFSINSPVHTPSYDIKISTSGSIWAGATTPLNSSFGCGDIEIVLAKYNTQLQLQNYIIVSTFRQDNLSRIFTQDDDNLVIVGTTDGKLQFPTEAAVNRLAFAAQIQYFSITKISSAIQNTVMTGELIDIQFSSLPPAALSGIPSVLVGNVASTQVYWNTTNLAARVPFAPGGLNELVVVFGYLQLNSSVSTTVTTLSLPVVSSVIPTQGPAVGFPITIDTLNLGYPGQDTAVVTVGGVLCQNIVQYDSKKLNCTAPPGTGRNKTVIVSLGSGLNSAEQFFISYDQPFLHSVAPAIGPTVGGNVLRIRGSNFGPCHSIFSCSGTEQNITVAINGKFCGSVTHHNDTDISCSAPSGIGVNHSLVVTVNGQSSTNSLAYSYAKPIINRLVPATSTSTTPTVFVEGSNYGPSTNMPVVVFQEIITQDLYPCSVSSWVSDSSVKWYELHHNIR